MFLRGLCFCSCLRVPALISVSDGACLEGLQAETSPLLPMWLMVLYHSCRNPDWDVFLVAFNQGFPSTVAKRGEKKLCSYSVARVPDSDPVWYCSSRCGRHVKLRGLSPDLWELHCCIPLERHIGGDGGRKLTWVGWVPVKFKMLNICSKNKDLCHSFLNIGK